MRRSALQLAALTLGGRPLAGLVALTATAGVLLNLILGLSRVALAMARTGDMPRALARIDAHGSPPSPPSRSACSSAASRRWAASS